LLVALGAIPVLTGCSAVGLQDLSVGSLVIGVDPAAAEADPAASPIPIATPMHHASSDGYSIDLPVGWGAADVSGMDPGPLLAAAAAADATLGALANDRFAASGAHLSLVGTDLAAAATGEFAPGIVVLTMRTRGLPRDHARSLVEESLAIAPVAGEPRHSVETHGAGDAHRYEATISGDRVSLHVQVWVFRAGGLSVILGTFAPVDQASAAQPALDVIVSSLRFGV
jgi:hypothetical protein